MTYFAKAPRECKWKRCDDGLTHCNVVSNGMTAAGQALSNFALTPFIVPDSATAGGKPFWVYNVEAWWTWWKYDAKAVIGIESGWVVKKWAKDNKPVACRGDPTEELLFDVYLAKLKFNQGVTRLLLNMNLPFTHYYFIEGAEIPTAYDWTGELWNEVALYIRGGSSALGDPKVYTM